MADGEIELKLVDLAVARQQRNENELSSRDTAIHVLKKAIERLEAEDETADVVPLLIMLVDEQFRIAHNAHHGPVTLNGLLGFAQAEMADWFFGESKGEEDV